MKFRVWFSEKKCTKWPQNKPGMFKVTGTEVHTLYTLEIRPFPSTSLWAVFELLPNFEKNALNDPKMTLVWSKSKVPICLLYTSNSFRSAKKIAIFEFPIEYIVKLFLITIVKLKIAKLQNKSFYEDHDQEFVKKILVGKALLI